MPLIEKHHARIFSMHLKDRKRAGRDQSENMPWGEGDTPIREVLQVLKKNRWAIPVGIEFEYPVPPGSTWDAEIAKCVKYGKDALGRVEASAGPEGPALQTDAQTERSEQQPRRRGAVFAGGGAPRERAGVGPRPQPNNAVTEPPIAIRRRGPSPTSRVNSE